MEMSMTRQVLFTTAASYAKHTRYLIDGEMFRLDG
jgi:hypothetical protein